MPLVRFATGDITFMTRLPCECGRLTPRIGPILGRRDQMLKIKGTTVYPAAVQRVLSGIEQITDFVMIATAPAPLSDELEILLAIRGEPRTILEIAREKLRGELKVLPKLRIASATEIHEKVHSIEFRKQRVFVDERPKTRPPS
jgi:phenylacetate-CoA ligase